MGGWGDQIVFKDYVARNVTLSFIYFQVSKDTLSPNLPF